jgi:hypothetical protein
MGSARTFERLHRRSGGFFGALISHAQLFGAVESFRKANFMTELNNRVLSRKGARTLTPAEIGKVSGATGIIITDVVTNWGKDFAVDHLEN